MPQYPEEETPENIQVWEESLFQEIRRSVKEIWVEAGRPAQVLLAVDGVVPMAKIRQQRARRFKSAWLRRGEGFDTNAITPGTRFMKRLTGFLEKVVREHTGWELSSVDEQGEGEHKVLQWIRAGKLRNKGNVIVYGLDADLILLTMLLEEEVGIPICLMREKEEFHPGLRGEEKKKQEYQWLSLAEFKKRLGVKGYSETLNYIGLMSLMGNDFLPHSITHKLNDDGHEYVMTEKRNGTIVVKGEPGKKPVVDWNSLREVCKRWSGDEKQKLDTMIQKKQDQARRGVLKGMEEREGLPLKWNVEKEIQDTSDWKSVYWNWLSPGTQSQQAKEIFCTEYWKGFQWILDYYTGHVVDVHWYYPSWLPPLWSDLAVGGNQIFEEERQGQGPAPPLPEEQLAMVLPLESWDLIENSEHRRLPILAPQYWPLDFGFQSAGRKWLWECEARIPSLSAARLREILEKEKQ